MEENFKLYFFNGDFVYLIKLREQIGLMVLYVLHKTYYTTASMIFDNTF